MPDSTDSTPAARQKEIFLAALELADAAERARFLDTACGGDMALRERIERLLRLEEESRDFLEPPPPAEAPPDFPQPQPGQAVGYFGDYILLDEVARGSSGVVFRARQSSLGRIVALKMLRDRPLLTTEAETKRFHAEAEAAASLDHANIVPIYEVGAHEGQAYFSMKLVEGGTLQGRAAEFTDPRKAAALMATVARAVHYAHGRGLLHRDLKPGNVLLDAAGEPHIADFGLAKKYGMDSSLTVSGQIMGTPHYMAPEQARGENRDLTPAADVYSLGAMLYELLGGRKPFAADDLVGLLKQVTDAAPPTLRSLVPSLDRDLETVVMRCLEKSPADRYASAAEFADDLDRWQRGEPVKARPAGVVRRILKWTKRRPVHAALAGLAALVVITSAALLWLKPWQSPAGPPPEDPAVVGTWQAFTEPAPALSRRYLQQMVWTGREVLIWGGGAKNSTYLNDGVRYDPATGRWQKMSAQGVPEGRTMCSIVWTGTEMIVWGGDTTGRRLGDGGRYDPQTDTWKPVSTAGAPSPRKSHAAVWTGREMIIWGGRGSDRLFNDGARYDPATDRWTPLPAIPALKERHSPAAVWTGKEMIIWSGGDEKNVFADGAAYDPGQDSWRALAESPEVQPRGSSLAVWTGAEMVIWGGFGTEGYRTAGARYRPETDTWRPVSATGEPAGRAQHSCVWTGTEMIVWGGWDKWHFFSDGARYNPATDSWTQLPSAGAPGARRELSAVWTGADFIVWGGDNGMKLADGGIWNAATNAWTLLGTPPPPPPASDPASAWTGNELLIWGGEGKDRTTARPGGRFSPASGTWRPINPEGAPLLRTGVTTVWTGTDWILWGGKGRRDAAGDGFRYRPESDTWQPVSTQNTPDARTGHTAVWTGKEMIVWGGTDGAESGDTATYYTGGGRYDPATDTWTALPAENAPAPRHRHAMTWTGREVLIWGGRNDDGYLPGGARFDPATGQWSPINPNGAPSLRQNPGSAWTGTEWIIWGGSSSDNIFHDGAAYDPVRDAWRPLAVTGAPAARSGHSLVWNGAELIVWGGLGKTGNLAGGARYHPATDTWHPLAADRAPIARTGHAAVWTGTQMLLWGGTNGAPLGDLSAWSPP